MQEPDYAASTEPTPCEVPSLKIASHPSNVACTSEQTGLEDRSLMRALEQLLELKHAKLEKTLVRKFESMLRLLQASVSREGEQLESVHLSFDSEKDEPRDPARANVTFKACPESTDCRPERQQSTESSTSADLHASRASLASEQSTKLHDVSTKSHDVSRASLASHVSRASLASLPFSHSMHDQHLDTSYASQEMHLILPDDIPACNARMRSSGRSRNRRQSVEMILDTDTFDFVMSAIIILNVLVMFLESEQRGYKAAVKFNLKPASAVVSDSSDFFAVADHFFNVVFLIELLLRIVSSGFRILQTRMIAFDAFLVLSSLLHYVTKYGTGSSGVNLNFLRIGRLVKVVKLLQAFRAAPFFSDLRILLRALFQSMMGLFWSSVTLFCILIVTGLFLAQTMADVVDDDKLDHELRTWVWMYYGTASRASYSMFEATLSGGWPVNARRTIEEVSGWYVVFWILYVIVVWFAVVRVLGAVFLQKTMKMSVQDDERMQNEKLKEGKDTYIKQIHEVLQELDEDNNGKMDSAELQAMLDHPSLRKWLGWLGLEVHDVWALFAMLADRTGEVAHDDLISGFMQLAGGVRAIDLVVLMHGQRKMSSELDGLVRGLETNLDVCLQRPSLIDSYQHDLTRMFSRSISTDPWA